MHINIKEGPLKQQQQQQLVVIVVATTAQCTLRGGSITSCAAPPATAAPASLTQPCWLLALLLPLQRLQKQHASRLQQLLWTWTWLWQHHSSSSSRHQALWAVVMVATL